MMDEQKSIMSEFAIASLVIGIAAFISLGGMEKAIIAIVLGILALKRIEKNQLSGRNLAIAGIILGIFSIIFTIVFLVKFFPKIQQRMKQMQSENIFMKGGKGLNDSQQPDRVPGTRLY